MPVAPKVAFLLAVAEDHPNPCCPLPREREYAAELARAGLLADLDEDHPGCFGLTPTGELMVSVLERRVLELP